MSSGQTRHRGYRKPSPTRGHVPTGVDNSTHRSSERSRLSVRPESGQSRALRLTDATDALTLPVARVPRVSGFGRGAVPHARTCPDRGRQQHAPAFGKKQTLRATRVGTVPRVVARFHLRRQRLLRRTRAARFRSLARGRPLASHCPPRPVPYTRAKERNEYASSGRLFLHSHNPYKFKESRSRTRVQLSFPVMIAFSNACQPPSRGARGTFRLARAPRPREALQACRSSG